MRHSLRIAVGPVQFRIGSDWAEPIASLRQLYADYPQDDTRPADATVRLFAARPWRRWLRPSVHIGGDFVVPDALPLPLSMGLLAAEMGMNLQVALGWRRHMLLHASAVEKDG
ncbi:MAG: HprK-related kinase A, partial [Sphingopyxis sp.]